MLEKRVPVEGEPVKTGQLLFVIDREPYIAALALQYQKSVQTAFQEVSDALIARQQDADVQAAQEAQVDAQRRANTIALARCRVGYASYFNVIDADRDLFTAELSLSEARLSTLLSVVQLYRALGGGWQIEEPVASGAHSP